MDTIKDIFEKFTASIIPLRNYGKLSILVHWCCCNKISQTRRGLRVEIYFIVLEVGKSEFSVPVG